MTTTAKYIIFICFIVLAYIIYDSINNSINNNEDSKFPVHNEAVSKDSLDNYIKSIENVEAKDEKKQTVSEDINCSILKVNLNNKVGFNISVGIAKKQSTSELVDIAKSIKNKVGTVSENGKVFFYLPEMPDDNGAWAVVNFNSVIDVEIIGKSLKDENTIRNSINNITDYYGLWYDNFSKGVSVFRIRNDKRSGYVYEYVDPVSPKQDDNASRLKKGMENGKVVFYDLDHIEDKVYFEIEKNGDLTQYDKSGFISTYKKLK